MMTLEADNSEEVLNIETDTETSLAQPKAWKHSESTMEDIRSRSFILGVKLLDRNQTTSEKTLLEAAIFFAHEKDFDKCFNCYDRILSMRAETQSRIYGTALSKLSKMLFPKKSTRTNDIVILKATSLLFKAKYSSNLDDFQTAVTALESITFEQIPDPEFYLNITFGLTKLRRYKDAEKWAHNGVVNYPNESRMHANYAFMLTLLDDPSTGLLYINSAISLDEPNYYVWNVMGYIQTKLGNFQEAVESFKKAIALGTDYIDGYVNLGISYSRLSLQDEAISALSSALEINKDHAYANYAMGLTTYRFAREKTGNQLKQSIGYLNRAISTRPYYLQALLARGVFYNTIGDFELAKSDFNTLLRYNSESVEALASLASSLAQTDHVHEAIRLLDRALEINKHSSLANRYKGLTLAVKLGRQDEAIQYLEEARKSEPLNRKAICDLAKCLILRNGNGDFEKAKMYLDAAYNACQTDHSVLATLAFYHASHKGPGSITKAIDILQMLFDSGDRKFDVVFHLGRLRLKRNRNDDSIAAFGLLEGALTWSYLDFQQSKIVACLGFAKEHSEVMSSQDFRATFLAAKEYYEMALILDKGNKFALERWLIVRSVLESTLHN